MMETKEYNDKINQIADIIIKKTKNGMKNLIELNINVKVYNFLKTYVKASLTREDANEGDILFLYMLSQFAIREYRGTEFYSDFCKAMGYQGKVNDTFFRKKIINTIKKYEMNEFGCFEASHECVECIKAHSLVYNSQQEEFLNSTYKIYDWLGFNVQNKEILRRELYYIQYKIKKCYLSSNSDETEILFGTDLNGVLAPRLTFPKSTCRFFAYNDIDTLMNVYYPILQMIDNWYYPDDEPNEFEERKVEWLNESFKKWSENQRTNPNQRSNLGNRKPYRNNSPFYKIRPDTQNDKFSIKIPEFIGEVSGENAEWNYEICCDGKVIKNERLNINSKLTFDQAIYWKTYAQSVEIDWEYIFKNISITIYQSITRNDDGIIQDDEIIQQWSVPEDKYRLFDSDGYQIKKVQCKKENILLTQCNYRIEQNNIQIIRETSTVYFLKYQFSADDNAIIKIDDIMLSTEGRCYSKPFFAQEITNFTAKESGSSIILTKKHPMMYIKCLENEQNNIVITITKNNKNKKTKIIKDIKRKICKDISDGNNVIVSFSVEDCMLDSTQNGKMNGVYEVEYGVSGQSLKSVKYVILQTFDFKFSRPRFYDDTCEIKFPKECSLQPVDNYLSKSTRVEDLEETYWQKYSVRINPKCEEIIFNLDELDVTIAIPVKKAIFGFEENWENAVFFRAQPSIPFSVINNTMYVKISGAKEMSISCNDKVVIGKEKGENFLFDLSSVLHSFHDNIPKKLKITYLDNKQRETNIRIHSVKPQSIEECLSEENGKLMCSIQELPDEISFIIDIFFDKNGQNIVCSKEFNRPGNYEITNIDRNVTYWIQRSLRKKSAVPCLPDEIFRIENTPKAKLLFDVAKLYGIKADIYDPKQKYKFKYSVKFNNEDRGRYLGELYENDEFKYKIAIYDLCIEVKRISGKILVCSNQCECCLKLENGELVEKIGSQPNNFYFTFDRNTFRKGD